MQRQMPVLFLYLVGVLSMSGCTSSSTVPLQQTLAETSPQVGPSWVRPTPRPAINTASQLSNLSNLPGADLAPSVAIGPDGTAAVIWANNPPESDESNVFVRVQDPHSGRWQQGIAVNTLPAYRFAAHPTISIDSDGRLHAFFAQDGLRLHYSRSTDVGNTWTEPELVPVPTNDGGAMAVRAMVDRAGVLHAIFSAGDCGDDCLVTWHLQRDAEAPLGTRWSAAERPLPGTKHLRSDLVAIEERIIVAATCSRGCGASRPVVALREDDGVWRERHIPGNVTHDDWEINWISMVRAGEQRVCLAWGHYARSGNFSSCSFDRGNTWEPAKPIIETYPPISTGDSAFTPTLLYEPLSDTLLAIQIYAQAGDAERQAMYPVFSIRRLHADHWVPDVAGPFGHANRSVPFRLFPAMTKSSNALAGDGLRVGYAAQGLALVVWVELVQDENLDLYSGWFHPAALLAETR